MKKLIIGAVYGIVGVLTCRTFYKKGFNDGVDAGVDVCKTVLKTYLDVQEAVEKKEEEA